MKKYRRVMSHETEEWFRVWRDMRYLVNFDASSDKSKYLHVDVLLLSIAYKVSAKKVQKNDLTWYWRVIETLKKWHEEFGEL